MAPVAQPLPEAPWGGLLAVYFVAVGVPSGVTLIAWWYRATWPVAGDAVERVAMWIALLVLGLASLLLVVDLGRPARFFLMLTRFDNLGSPISVGAKIIAIKCFLLVVAIYLRQRRRGSAMVERALGNSLPRAVDGAVTWSLGIASVALAIYPVAVLSRSWLAPLARMSGAALIYLLTALLMGMAVCLTAQAVLPVGDTGAARRGLRLGTLFLLAAYGVAMAFEALAVHGDPRLATAAHDVVSGAHAPAFWGLVCGVGVLVPSIGLTALPHRRGVQLVCGLAILFGTSTSRYLIFAVQ